MKKTLIISSLLLILIVLMTAVSAADNTTTLTQENDEIITIENGQINEINDSSAGIDTNSGLEQNFTSESETLSPKNTDSQSKNLKTNFKNNILTATNTDDLLTDNRQVTGSTFADIRNAINSASPGDNIYLMGRTYTGSGTAINVNKQVNIYGGSPTNPNLQAILNANELSRMFTITATNVLINNVKFTNGKANGTGNNANGGAILWTGAYGTVDKCGFTNNKATRGGAIYWSGANGTIKDSNFTNNKANRMGALTVNGDNCIIEKVNIINNHAQLNSEAIQIVRTNNTLNYDNFINNSAGVDGALGFVCITSSINNCNFIIILQHQIMVVQYQCGMELTIKLYTPILQITKHTPEED